MSCPDCSAGTLHEGTPTGKVETVHGLPTYIAEPPSEQPPKGIIVIIPDAFGWELVNCRILADTYAKRCNARVFVPDFMDGHWVAHDLLYSMDAVFENSKSYLTTVMKIFPLLRSIYHMVPFIYLNRVSVAKPRVYGFLKALRANEAADLPVGVAGFCWGGKYVTLLTHDDEKAANGMSLIDCGFTAHPSQLVVPDDIKPVKLPLSIAIGDIDIALAIGKVNIMKGILEEKGKMECVIIKDAKHGFAVRGHPGNEVGVKQCMQAEDQAVNWYLRWFEAFSK